MGYSALILAGGLSSRMGENKALLEVGEKKMIERAVEKLSRVGEEVIISSNQPELYGYLGLPVVKDVIPQQGPLSGIHAGLLAARNHHVFVAACDMPFIDEGLAQYMLKQAEGFDVVVPQLGDYLQPLYAVYSKNCIQPIEGCLRQGVRKIIAFYYQVRIRYIGEETLRRFAPDDRVFFNVNTPDELRQANQFAKELKR